MESGREKAGFYVATALTIVPAMIASGFMPEWDVLPFAGWLAIAVVGGALGGAIATSRVLLGAITGAVGGLGAVLGVFVYVLLRSAISDTFFGIELAVGAVVGGGPGLLAFHRFARDGVAAPADRP